MPPRLLQRFVGALALSVAVGIRLAIRWQTDVGISFTADSVRDYASATSILRGWLPIEGPAVGKLGFSLGLLYYHMLAALLAVHRSLETLVVATHASEVASLVVFGLVVARLTSVSAGAFAVLLAVFNEGMHSNYTWFVHGAFSSTFELLAVLAMIDAHLRDRPERLALSLGLISVAAQLHASVLPLFLVPLLLTPLLRRDARPRAVALGWLLFLLPFMPLVGDSRFRSAARANVAVALGSWLAAQTLLIPSLLYVWIAMRPGAVVRGIRTRDREGRAFLRVAGAGLLAYVAMALGSGRAPTLRLMNIEIHRPPGLQSGVAFRSTADVLATMFGSRDARFTALAAAVAVLGLAAAVWSATRAPSGSEPRRRSCFLLVWVAVMAPVCGFMFARADFASPQYLMHGVLPTLALGAWGVHAIADRFARRIAWHDRAGVWGYLPGLGWWPVAAVAVGSSVDPALASGPIRESLSFHTAATAVWRTFYDRVGLGDAMQTHLHGTDGRNVVAEVYNTPWCILVDTRTPRAPRPGTDPRVHYRLWSTGPSDPLVPGQQSIAGTLLAWAPYRTALHPDRAVAVVSVTPGVRALPLPYRYHGRTSDFRATLLPGTSSALVPPRFAVADIVITLPRDASDGVAPDGIMVVAEGPSLDGAMMGGGGGQCRVDASLGGVALAQAGDDSAAARPSFAVAPRAWRFVIPPRSPAASLTVRLRGCNPWYLDVYDLAPPRTSETARTTP